jgi:hypothetical protein
MDAPAAFFVKTVAAILFRISDTIAPGVNLAILKRFVKVNDEGMCFSRTFNGGQRNGLLMAISPGDWNESGSG